jgi:hypothetical protein
MSFIKIGGFMNIDTAKKMLDSSYLLLEGKKSNQLIEGETPSFGMMLDGTQIIGPDLKELNFEPSPILEKFLLRYKEVWDKLKKESWTEDDTKELIGYDNERWDQFVE